jgi:D-glycero-alpha-D-manno-heptose-7-phosphate kinase
LNVPISVVEELEAQILLFFTGLSRSANTILAAQHKDTEEGKADVVESLHTTKELGLRIKHALEEHRLDDFGLMMHEHWENKKKRSSQISDPRIDDWYDAARHAGALGGKIVGAGGGGFLMLYCPREAKGTVRAALASRGLKEMPFRFDFEGAKTMINL